MPPPLPSSPVLTMSCSMATSPTIRSRMCSTSCLRRLVASGPVTDVGVPAIRLEGLTKYHGAVVGIEDLSLDVEPGEVFGFLGANGAGKTTTIRTVLDLLRPTRGSASVMGFDCQRQSFESRRRIGYLPGEMPEIGRASCRERG